MSTSSEIKLRAKALAEKTDVNSISPQEVGGIMQDLASHSENVLRNGGTLGIRKVYVSVEAMEADRIAPVDFWGNPIKKGNLVVIYDGTTTGLNNNQIYAFMNPGWELATELDAGYAMRAETEAKLSELGSKVDVTNGVLKILNVEFEPIDGNYTYGGDIELTPRTYHTPPIKMSKNDVLFSPNIYPTRSMVSQVTEDGTWIKAIYANSSSDYIELSVLIEEDMFVSVGYYTPANNIGYVPKIYVKKSGDYENSMEVKFSEIGISLDEVKSEVEKNLLLGVGLTINDASYLKRIKFNGYGEYLPSVETVTYDKKIKVNGIDKLYLYGKNGFCTGATFYDKEFTYIGQVWYENINTLNVMEGAYYAIVGFRRKDQSDGFTEDELMGYNIELCTLDSSLMIMLKSLSYIITSNDSIIWADGSSGQVLNAVYNEDVLAYESFEVTHADSGLKVVQPKITYDDDFSIKNRPQLVISKI